ncbi:MAG: helix-turn-helix domain-containing protein [Anaerolineae bacterium]
MSTKKYHVTLTPTERETCQKIIHKGRQAAAKIRRAHLLLAADEAEGGLNMTDEEIKTAYHISLRTVERLRQRFVEEGFEVVLQGKSSGGPQVIKIDGEVEAHLIALRLGAVPAGRNQWTMRLLAEKMVELAYVDSISHESVRQVLKKTNSNPSSGLAG